jgi:hypothetical protein
VTVHGQSTVGEKCCHYDVAIEYKPQRCQLQLARSMSQILDSMSQPTVVSGHVMRPLSSESSDKARYSQVNAILSYDLKKSCPGFGGRCPQMAGRMGRESRASRRHMHMFRHGKSSIGSALGNDCCFSRHEKVTGPYARGQSGCEIAKVYI